GLTAAAGVAAASRIGIPAAIASSSSVVPSTRARSRSGPRCLRARKRRTAALARLRITVPVATLTPSPFHGKQPLLPIGLEPAGQGHADAGCAVGGKQGESPALPGLGLLPVSVGGLGEGD